MLIAPRLEPDDAGMQLVYTAGQTFVQLCAVGGRNITLLRAVAAEIPLQLLQEAGLAKAPVTMDADHVRRLAGGDGIADLADKRPAFELVEQRRFVIVQRHVMALKRAQPYFVRAYMSWGCSKRSSRLLPQVAVA